MSQEHHGIPPAAGQQRVTEHLANERTHLAYLRTSVSLIGLGIAINRFSLYLAETQGPLTAPRWSLIDSSRMGIGLVVLGMSLLIWALVRYRQAGRQIDRQDYRPNNLMVAIITLAVFILGSVSLFWLFLR